MKDLKRLLLIPLLIGGAMSACDDDPADPDDPEPVASVTVAPDTATIDEGAQVQLAATLQDADQNVLTGRTITWASDDTGVATVDANGLVTGAGGGSATITATSEGIDGTATITVIAAVPMEPVLSTVADGFTQPTYVTSTPSSSDRLFVIEREGVIHVIEGGTVNPTPFLDYSASVGCCMPGGAFTMAFHPDYDTNGLFYLFHYTTNSETQVTEFTVSGDPDVADAGSARAIITFPQIATATHFGTQLQFGQDGYLYISVGDGSDAGDALMNGQDSTNMYGTVLRIDVDSGDPYSVPADNPFVGDASVPDEIWAYGLRNPWRFSFDRANGDLYLSENGENSWEEINYAPGTDTGGQNYGWSVAEGNHCYPTDPCDMTGLTAPIHEVAHDETDPMCSGSMVGGYVYRGGALPDLRGTYFYADFCTQKTSSFRVEAGAAVDHQDWTGDLGITRPVSFGEDADGELYLVSFAGTVYKIDAQPVS